MVPIKVYLTMYENRKNSYLKIVFVDKIPEVTVKDCQGFCSSKYGDLLDHFGKNIAEALPR